MILFPNSTLDIAKNPFKKNRYAAHIARESTAVAHKKRESLHIIKLMNHSEHANC